MAKRQFSSLEWMGRVMGPDPLVHDIVVGGAKRREQQRKQDAVIAEAWTLEADAWNRLASIGNLCELDYLTIAGISLQPAISIFNYELSSPDEVIPFQDFRFRRVQHHGPLCQQWQLL